MSPIKVVLADPHTLFCESVLALLEPEDTLHLCAMAPDGGALLQAVEGTVPMWCSPKRTCRGSTAQNPPGP